VLASGNTIMPGVRYEDYVALLLRAVREFGAYPLHEMAAPGDRNDYLD